MTDNPAPEVTLAAINQEIEEAHAAIATLEDERAALTLARVAGDATAAARIAAVRSRIAELREVITDLHGAAARIREQAGQERDAAAHHARQRDVSDARKALEEYVRLGDDLARALDTHIVHRLRKMDALHAKAQTIAIRYSRGSLTDKAISATMPPRCPAFAPVLARLADEGVMPRDDLPGVVTALYPLDGKPHRLDVAATFEAHAAALRTSIPK